MANWTSDELKKIGTAEELELSSKRSDGTFRNPVTMWVVRVGVDLYVRSVKGRTGPWFRGAQSLHEGRVQAGGVKKEVTFVEEDNPNLNNQLDEAYRAKYHRYPANILNSILTPQARAATLKLVARA